MSTGTHKYTQKKYAQMRFTDWLDGAADMLGRLLATKLGTPLDVEFPIGWLDGVSETDGLADGMEDG